MKDVILKTSSGTSVIHCGEGTFEKYAPSIASRQCFIVTDKNVFAYYRYLIWKVFGDNVPIHIIPPGEDSKSFTTLKSILSSMLNSGMKRNCTVIAFGGGVVGDIAGLAASLYMRGVRLVQIPTSLLAQADSSVGGKTAIDFGGAKNLIGSFYLPEEVITDSRFLSTLPEREIRCGLGEIIKCGALDERIFESLKLCANLKDFTFLEDIIFRCVQLKAQIVGGDERDLKGIRKTLNLGHTTGHAFEEFYSKKSHGEFVLIGMYYEMYIAEKLNTGDKNYFEELRKLILRVIKIPVFADISSAAELAEKDKKNDDENISLIVPFKAGKCTEIKLSVGKYKELLEEYAENLKVRNG